MSTESNAGEQTPTAPSNAAVAPATSAGASGATQQGPTTTATKSSTQGRSLLLGGAIGFAVLAGAMAIQSARHGWPFSLHHGYVEVRGKVQRAAPSMQSSKAGAEAQPRAAVMLAASRATEFGIRVEAAKSAPMARTIRAVAVVVPDESRVSEIHARVSGWIEQLYVNKTGQSVRAGQALAGIFSPDLLAAQNELFAVKKAPTTGGQSPLLEGARSRLRVLGMTDAQVAALEAQGQPTRLVTISSPRQGVVIRRNVAVGTAIDPSTELMTVADLSKAWVLAEIPERDVPDVPKGTASVLEFAAAGAGQLNAKVAFVYPTLTERTRTLRVRFELDNPGERLKPGMYGNATFETGERRALTVPRDAVVDTGIEQHVFVVERPEYYVPRKVEVGVTLGNRVEIRSGLAENENVVASGVFLVDSESRLRASGGGAMAGMKMDSDSSDAQMSGMAMPTASGSSAAANVDIAQGQPSMPGVAMPSSAPVARPRAAPAGQRPAQPPIAAPSPHDAHSAMPTSMPGMDMRSPDSAPMTHAGHGE